MLPTNSGHAKDHGCSPVSSNCVIWQGPDLDCIALCKGDTVSDVIAKMALELCKLVEMFKLEDFDFSCLAVPLSEQPADMHDLIQILIERICALENITPITGSSGSTECPDCMVAMESCFYYDDPATGDQVLTSTLANYVSLIANKVCDNITDIIVLQDEVDTLQAQVNNTGGLVDKIDELEIVKVNRDELNYQLSSYTTAGAPIKFLPDATRDIENSIIQQELALGNPTQMYQSILKDGGVSQEKVVYGEGNFSGLTGWINEPTVLAESIGNHAIQLANLREAIRYINLNNVTGCSTLVLNFRVTLTPTVGSAKVTILTDGSTGFTPEWKECGAGTSPVTITDESGNSTTTSMSLISLISNPAGQVIDLTGSSIDITQTLEVTVDTCFENHVSNVTCNNTYKDVIYAASMCPVTVLTVYATSVSYEFTSASTYSYIVNVYLSGGITPVVSQIIAKPGVTVLNVITGLMSITDYELEVVVVDGAGTETPCAKQPFTTLPDNCTPPVGVTAILTI